MDDKDRYARFATHFQSRRLAGYDYSLPGFYFISIVTENRACLFGAVKDGRMVLNRIGEIVKEEWLRSEKLRKEISFDHWIIMPNHLHAIVLINDSTHPEREGMTETDTESGAEPRLKRHPKSLSTLVSGFKSAVTRRIRRLAGSTPRRIWQRNYHDHIIRDERDLNNRRQYIVDNPVKWEQDRLNPKYGNPRSDAW